MPVTGEIRNKCKRSKLQIELAISRANTHYTPKIPETDTRTVPDYRKRIEHCTPVFLFKEHTQQAFLPQEIQISQCMVTSNTCITGTGLNLFF